MDEKFAIAFIAAFFSFLFFVILDLWKTSRGKKERNIRALRSILVELKEDSFLYSDGGFSEATFKAFSPINLSSRVWENNCGEIVLPNKDQEALELAFKNILFFNTAVNCFVKLADTKTMSDEDAQNWDQYVEEFHQSTLSEFPIILSGAIKSVENNIEVLEKETLYITVLKEFFGPSHRIITLLQDFPKKTSTTKN